ncbi:hypothetical protein MESS2_p130002 [Mesorhizobium metallidurans STM 2683]|uniref:Uncharacterized protein n=1 Tax=Mesorhizobium metallidurans STM 2683 TaxID=1297569 RepID=M5FC08_9HYPH|nr:hypothetical protein MESS2_p130002 [Mesorhizobium metallidurans STM 2683]
MGLPPLVHECVKPVTHALRETVTTATVGARDTCEQAAQDAVRALDEHSAERSVVTAGVRTRAVGRRPYFARGPSVWR